jgi:hypothetical protein
MWLGILFAPALGLATASCYSEMARRIRREKGARATATALATRIELEDF